MSGNIQKGYGRRGEGSKGGGAQCYWGWGWAVMVPVETS